MDPNRVEAINGFNRLAVYGDGFDSHRPLQNSRRSNWSCTAGLAAPVLFPCRRDCTLLPTGVAARAPVARLMRDELEVCYVQRGFRPSFRRGHGQVVHSYRDTERLKVFL